jgi:uncharacterized protein (TIGR02452 family)
MTTKVQRIAIQMDTMQSFKQGQYINAKGHTVLIDPNDIKKTIQSTKYHSSKEVEYALEKQFSKPKYTKYNETGKINGSNVIFNKDTLETAHILQEQGLNPVILNMASFRHPGGGYMNGASAQEESLFRKTCLHLCLDGNKRETLYPIGMDSAIYSQDVLVVKDESYQYFDQYKKVSVISCPAYKCTSFDGEEYSDKIKQLMKKKLELIIRIAILYDHDSIVLGAFGCGAYHNPANIIAELCKELIEKYKGYFKCIVFAILDDRNSHDNSAAYGYAGGNLQIFSKTIGIPIIN